MHGVENHYDHWMEPKSLTDSRGSEEKFCESCGEEIPWHLSNCQLLKVAYNRRKTPCHWCGSEYFVGAAMFEHTTTAHQSEIEADPRIKLATKTRPVMRRS